MRGKARPVSARDCSLAEATDAVSNASGRHPPSRPPPAHTLIQLVAASSRHQKQVNQSGTEKSAKPKNETQAAPVKFKVVV